MSLCVPEFIKRAVRECIRKLSCCLRKQADAEIEKHRIEQELQRVVMKKVLAAAMIRVGTDIFEKNRLRVRPKTKIKVEKPRKKWLWFF